MPVWDTSDVRRFGLTLRRASASRGVRSIVAIGIFHASSAAAEPDKAACIEAYQSAQVDMQKGALVSARTHLDLCLSPACPAALQSDCAGWLKDVELRQSTVVFAFKGANGAASVAVPLSVDGKPFNGTTDGRAHPLDPGPHEVVFQPEGEPAVKLRVAVREGEKAQRIEATSTLWVERPVVEKVEKKAPPPIVERPVPWTVFALSGVAVVGAATFAIAGGAGLAGKSDLDACKPGCPTDDVSSVQTRFAIADVGVIVAGLAAIGATTLYLTRPEVTRPSVAWTGTGVHGVF